mgnify:CR=1 FL=1|mmetsp:Transcript_7570/g.23557  ORF Transcript_7570/g.23557 Transcript_7570/m.23557 type:complete len:162 (+) Transcript_7570:33-518(+)|eukprot:scaffold102659_cov28-Tisochrysis_lutea.AAC.1
MSPSPSSTSPPPFELPPELAPLAALPLGPRDQARAKAAGRALLVPLEAALAERARLEGGGQTVGHASWLLFTSWASLQLQIEEAKTKMSSFDQQPDGSVSFGLALLAALGPMALEAASRKRSRESGEHCPHTPPWKRASPAELDEVHLKQMALFRDIQPAA